MKAALERIDTERIQRERLDPGDAHDRLARYLSDLLRRALHGAAGSDRGHVANQLRLANQIIDAARQLAGDAIGPDDNALDELLLAVLPPPDPLTGPRTTERPSIPLAASALLVNGPDQPRIGRELPLELATADRVELICAFIKWEGLRTIRDALEEAAARGVPIRVITTTYIGATDRRALDALVDLGADVKVSYDTRTTRLHAKAWLFHRNTGASTAYIGSSNLSRAALLDGLEWNVRVAALEQPHLVDTFTATFDNYWADPAFEDYDPARDADRFDQAIAMERGGPVDLPLELTALDVRPFGYQQEILDTLAAERQLHRRRRNLVVAATGTGKTVMAALDYARLRAAGSADRLLFVAHRHELLQQSLSTFRHVLRDGAFGELLVGGARPQDWTHVFASVQSLARIDLERLDPQRFDMVIVDEFHHAEAPTYTRLLAHLEPDVLLGLTATPERADGRDVTHWFGGRIAAELRLWEALERGLLCPFQYFGVHDDVDVSDVPWRRGAGYDLAELSRVYTGHHARARLVVQALRDTVADVGGMRALGFCVSIDHAEFMAERFTHHGVPAVAVSTRSNAGDRRRALDDLRQRRVNAVFAVDLFNEGVDVPEVDTVLFLRPTESPTVFLQQLGRGLRLADDKPCLTVLDFIGNQHARFRFDLRYRALTGASRRQLERQIKEGFPYLPAGCHLELDRVAAEVVLSNVRKALHLSWRDLVAELRALGDVELATFLAETGLQLEEVYSRQARGWAGLRRNAGFDERPPGPDDEALGRAIGRLLHVDDPERLDRYRRLLHHAGTAPLAAERSRRDERLAAERSRREGPLAAERSRRDERLAAMFHFALWGPGTPLDERNERQERLARNPARIDELEQVLALLGERIARLTPTAPGDRPLHVHAHYSRDEAVAAFGMDHPSIMRQGVRFFPDERADVFFVTLRKSEDHYSPTTRYNDHALSPELFHWESQSTTPADSPTGRRYINHEREGTSVHLFVRESRTGDGPGAPPYLYAGTASYVSHDGERPMKIVWRLHTPLPPDLFHIAKIAAG